MSGRKKSPQCIYLPKKIMKVTGLGDDLHSKAGADSYIITTNT